MGKIIEQTLNKKGYYHANKHQNTYSESLVIIKMKVKTLIRCPYTTTRMD